MSAKCIACHSELSLHQVNMAPCRSLRVRKIMVIQLFLFHSVRNSLVALQKYVVYFEFGCSDEKLFLFIGCHA